MARREDTAHLDALLTEPEDRHTLAESITGRLRKLILDGQLRPGQALRPADLAPRLGVSAMPVREALRILEAEGLVTFKPRIGARVAEIGRRTSRSCTSSAAPSRVWRLASRPPT